jgi:hypothetical protein
MGVVLKQDEHGLTPTEPVLLSQHAGVLRQHFKKVQSPEHVSQSLEEVLGEQHIASEVTPLETIPITNNEAISNSSSPIVNEKLQHILEEQANEGKISL